MAEIYFQGPCNRQMNITINGVAVQPSPFDPFAAAGAAYQAIDLTVPGVTAPSGKITVVLAPVSGSSPKLSAIQIQ